jgi:hypothetical protein
MQELNWRHHAREIPKQNNLSALIFTQITKLIGRIINFYKKYQSIFSKHFEELKNEEILQIYNSSRMSKTTKS